MSDTYNHYCKVKINSEPVLPGLQARVASTTDIEVKPVDDGVAQGFIQFPFDPKDSLVIMQYDQLLVQVQLSRVSFTKESGQINPQLVNIEGKQYVISAYFEIQQYEKFASCLRFDLSISGLPIKAKCFSCVPEQPLTFYEICNSKSGLRLYQSEITRFPSQDPIFIPSEKIPKTDLQPSFRVNVYNSRDAQKERYSLIGTVEVDYDVLVNQKEFMFELENMDKTYVIIDRVQEVV